MTKITLDEVKQVYKHAQSQAYEKGLDYEEIVDYQLKKILIFIEEKEMLEDIFVEETKAVYLRNLNYYYGIEDELQDN